ncbi:MAG: hypothetical protein UY09_C0010G0002 [Parcubacteria group bacterium GW2011_GWA2_47_8]|nr:MAG: hypothetical protein UY09_C0010G0002 [Parcubacteria group bacterium GW2011_GWA2_47_8]OHB19694.1 MAG: hypothetical protein A2666_04115 [Parcubacteria group bacterium RIFCSPHIGHO2_01_FULL_47_10b]
MVRTQIYLQKSQLNQLRRLARSKRATVSDVIRSILTGNLEQTRSPESGGIGIMFDAFQRIGALARKDTPRDLASRMDDYLYKRP